MTWVPVVDLFSGPGGLAEGFAALRDSNGSARFRISLSIEMNKAAFRTLRLRSFLRKFSDRFPPEYYEYLNGLLSDEPDWAKLYPEEWREACDETYCLKLGTPEATSLVRQRIHDIREAHGDRTILLGGPPCQSYSIVGRARNAGNADYNADKDERQFLYHEYSRVLGQLRPAVAVMENVRGMLSARHKDRLVFPDVMESLQHAGGKSQYRLYAFTSPFGDRSWDEGLSPKDFLVRAEQYGIPQARHRVFVICVRRDLANNLPKAYLPRLEPAKTTVSLHDVIGLMPTLRSRLSWDDDEETWQHTVRRACTLVRENMPDMDKNIQDQFSHALECASQSTQERAPPYRNAKGGTVLANTCPVGLREWIADTSISRLPNNEARSHIHEDITRYLFAAAFAFAFGKSPKAFDFPAALAPKHVSWDTGSFDDRFRVQLRDRPSTTVTSHLSKDGHYFIHPDPSQCRTLTVREVARLQTFPDNYFFHGSRTQQYIQVGNAVPPYLARQMAESVQDMLDKCGERSK